VAFVSVELISMALSMADKFSPSGEECKRTEEFF
jgi:hypothetical protein